ncbi:MAG: beta-lactamase family protein [Saprospiraceae bacterium]|nr:beta-lactamase family protein [Saprospiraceae bacterium]
MPDPTSHPLHYRFLIVALFLPLPLFSQTPTLSKAVALTTANPESVGMSSSRLARIDQMCLDAIENQEVPGIVALVARHGKIVFHKAFGQATADGRVQKNDDIFRIASQSKAITSTAVMMLWEEGKFRLDDPISDYIPEFRNPQILANFRYSDTSYTTTPADKEITIRHLLTHTSGLGYGIIDGDERFKMIYQKAGITDLFSTQPVTIKESVLKLANLPLHHNPGEKYTYSEGLDVLGYFIEVISGLSFDEFLRTRLFDPLGMSDTYFYLPDSKAKRLVAVQQRLNNEWSQYPVTFYDTDYPIKGAKSFYSGGAGLSSTARDYATFLQMYLNGGALNGVRILSRTTVQSILSNQVGELLGDQRNYGLAFGLTTAIGAAKGGNASTGTFDWGGYFNTQYFADPQEGLIGVIMKQTQGPVSDQTSWKFRILVEQAVDD